MNDNIYIVVGSYKYYRNAVVLHKKLKIEGFENAKILKRTNGFFRVSLIHKSSRLEIDKFIKANNLDYKNFWLLYENESIVDNKNVVKKKGKSSIKTIKKKPEENKITLNEASLKKNKLDSTKNLIPKNKARLVVEKIKPITVNTTKEDRKEKVNKSYDKIYQDTVVINVPTRFML